MNREQYLQARQGEQGWRPWGVFPAQYPKEVFWAQHILPVEIWDPPLKGGQGGRAEAHLQPYICSVVKLGLDLALSGRADMVEGFVFPHTCDSIQNLASVVNDYLNLDKPCLAFYHPKAPYAKAARQYYMDQARQLARELNPAGELPDRADLRQAVDQNLEIYGLAAKLYQARARDELDLSNAEFFRLLRLGEYLTPEDFSARLAEALERPFKQPSPRTTKVVLSGVLPSPPGLLDLLDDLGVAVAADDLICCGRRLLPASLPRPLSESGGDPWQAMAEVYFSLPPCSTKASPLAQRLDWLKGLAKKSGAKGFIFYEIKFCETELFDLPNLKKGLEAAGLACLILDVEAGEPFSGRLATRVEAFIEMIS